MKIQNTVILVLLILCIGYNVSSQEHKNNGVNIFWNIGDFSARVESANNKNQFAEIKLANIFFEHELTNIGLTINPVDCKLRSNSDTKFGFFDIRIYWTKLQYHWKNGEGGGIMLMPIFGFNYLNINTKGKFDNEISFDLSISLNALLNGTKIKPKFLKNFKFNYSIEMGYQYNNSRNNIFFITARMDFLSVIFLPMYFLN
jgi:hypothetical protein